MNGLELKPCPFCGGEAFMVYDNDIWVSCEGCRADGPYFDNDEAGEIQAVEAWNRRQPNE